MQNQEMIFSLIQMLMSGGDTNADVTPVQDAKEQEKGRYIVIGNRGNVVVGDLVIKGSTGCLSNAAVIRRWGTTKGLGQLALEGKQADTILDPCGEFEFELLTTCGMIPVKSDF